MDNQDIKSVAPLSMRNPVHLLAFGFGSGLAPRAPGTLGTVAAMPFCYILLLLPQWYPVVLVVSFGLGIWLCGRTATDMGVHDHGGIVWDEFVGMWLTIAPLIYGLVPTQWWSLVAAFVLFRLFDILKPWPIAWLDRRVDGGLGIMIDDVLAGIYAALVLWGVVSLLAGAGA